ncbi:MAG: hypothetical protein GX833_07785 [Clostridium sp.]|nr:hypothetical protein [Clostridium sp.]
MNPFLMKFVNDGFFNEAVGEHIDAAIQNGESVIVAGHRSTGTRPFMANLMAIAKKTHPAVQVKKAEDLEKEAKYFLIPGIPNIDFEALIYDAIKIPDTSIISIKEPEQPLSLMKLFKKLNKEEGPTTKVFHQIECDKKDGVPFVSKVTTFSMDDKGKVKRENLDF